MEVMTDSTLTTEMDDDEIRVVGDMNYIKAEFEKSVVFIVIF